jgi:hypothetical protein
MTLHVRQCSFPRNSGLPCSYIDECNSTWGRFAGASLLRNTLRDRRERLRESFNPVEGEFEFAKSIDHQVRVLLEDKRS